MKYTLALFLCLLLVTDFITAQNSFSDHNTKKAKQIDSLYKTAINIADSNPNKADSIANKIIELTLKNDKNLKALAYIIKGEANYYQQNYDSALQMYMDAAPLLKELNDSVKIAGNYSNLGLIYLLKANYKTALSYYDKSYHLESLLNDSIGMAKSLQNMGLIAGNWQRYELQQSYYQQSLKIYEKLKEIRSIADISLNLGVSLITQEKYKDGLQYYKDALKAYEQLQDSSRIASVYTNIGYYHVRTMDFDKANLYLNKAIFIFKKLKDKTGLLNTYAALGDVCAKQGNKQKAIELYTQCEKINASIGLTEIRINNLFSLYEAYKEIGNFEKALYTFETYKTLSDSIYSNENLNKILDLENKYLKQKNQNQITRLKSRNRLYTIIFLAISFILIFGGVFFFFFNRDKGMKEKQRLLALEQNVLRTQMNPHFIFNSLSVVQCYILENKTMESVDFLADFAGLMRMVLHYSKEQFITLSQEKEVLDYYIDLQIKRFGDNVKYEIEIDENIDRSKTMIPPMLAQPFIENSFEHGELCKMKDGKITVKFEKKGTNLSYRIEDNGIGILSKKKEVHRKNPTTNNKKHKSLAIKITKERLLLINKNHLGQKINLTVQDKSKFNQTGTLVEFTIPLREMN